MRKYNAFTLIEMLIAIAIIAIIAGVALPSYQSHIQKSNRIAAQLALSKFAQEFERTHARKGAYPSTLPSIDATDSYTFALPVVTDNTFTITATPVTDDMCGILSINQAGQTSSSKSTDCWD